VVLTKIGDDFEGQTDLRHIELMALMTDEHDQFVQRIADQTDASGRQYSSEDYDYCRVHYRIQPRTS
jgi:hypothetical protein